MRILHCILLSLPAFLFGKQTMAQTAIDRKGTVQVVDTSKWRISGSDIYSKASGNVGIGITTPQYKLDVAGKLRASDTLIANRARILNLGSGSISDSMIVIDPATNILKVVSPRRLSSIVSDSTTASNGLSMQGKDVRLGGTLASPTTIVTTSINTLSLTGLASGSITTDSLLVATSAGVVKRTSYPVAQFPRLELDANRVTSYTPVTTYAAIVYNSASVNVGTQYNTGTGVFTAAAAGLYQVLVSNMYFVSATGSHELRNRIILNGATVHLEGAVAFGRNNSTAGSHTLSLSTVLQLNAGDNIVVQSGDEVGTVNPRVGTGQHNIKVLRLK